MAKKTYTTPRIILVHVIPEGDTCGVPVFFSTPGPGHAGAKQAYWEDESDEVVTDRQDRNGYKPWED